MNRLPKFLAFAAFSAMGGNVAAQTMNKPLVIISPYAAGGPVDLLARVLAKDLGQRLHQNVIVETKAGAGAAIGANYVAKADPDGYTLLLATPAALIVTPAMAGAPYNGLRDFKFVGMVDDAADMLVVNPTLPVKNLRQLVAYAKAHPGMLNYGTAGVGTSPFIDGETFKQAAKIDIRHVPYKGATPALSDVVANHIQIGISNTSSVQPFVQGGQLRALAYAAKERAPSMPSVPTFGEQGLPEVVSSSWRVLAVPVATPDAVVNKLGEALRAVQADPEFVKQLTMQGSNVFMLDSAKAKAYIHQDSDRTFKLLGSLHLLKADQHE
jgi:tripartite-type tricarboxylate transporter receptor subunit TctC